ncbi:MAG TPA: Ig-like domain-containing protein, partial [Kofleriaceae bacterium]|nr:Ig-like domain-containing protein [Kofleriaceae bacterium]
MDTALRWISQPALWGIAASLVTACSDPSSATDLHPEGPPMVEQVRLEETFTVGGTTGHLRVVFGFGTHPDATPDDEHQVTTATANGNKLRIIMDELLRGNDLEEIKCRTIVDSDAFAKVPVGATPDDIARCSVAQGLLPSRCPGNNPRSVCLCANDGGCPVVNHDGSTVMTPKGESVGVLDSDQDGAADTHRFIQGAVGIRCGMIDVPIDLDNSYWTPSGDQQTPAQGGFDALGPAVVLIPGPAPDVALPTNVDCGLVFSSDVVDKDGNQVCAPRGGDVAAGCTPGDTSAMSFHVEPMTLALATAVNGAVPLHNAKIQIQSNTPVDHASLSNITVTQDPGTPYTQFTVDFFNAVPTATPPIEGTPTQIVISFNPDLPPSTHFTIDVPTTVTDRYHQGPQQPLQ